MKRADSTSDGFPAVRPGMLRRMVSIPEGKILMAGMVLVCLHVAAVGLTRLSRPELSHSLLIMTVAHVLGGRAAGVSWGYVNELPVWIVILTAMSVETFLVLLVYPLFVFSYRKLIIIRPLEDAMSRVQRTAQAHQKTIMKFGVPGLLLFVWFPFWMTGPVAGAIIGFLIGLRPRANLGVVLAGTYLAILCWSIVLQRVHVFLRPLGPYVQVLFVAAILLVAVSIHIRYAFSHHAHEPVDDEHD